MLHIDPEQMAVLQRAQSAAFVVKLMRLLRSAYGERLAVLSPEAQALFAERIVAQGPEWGLHTESEIAELAMLVMEIKLVGGPQQPMPSWFASVVNDGTLHAQAKLYQLVSRWREELDALFSRPRAALQAR